MITHIFSRSIASLIIVTIISSAYPMIVAAQSSVDTLEVQIQACTEASAPGQVPVSVVAEAQTIPVIAGETATFSGEIVNDASFPLTDATVFATVYRAEETLQQVDALVAADELVVPAGGATAINFTWEVPELAPAGSYRVLFYVLDAGSYIAGLPYSQGATAGSMSFTVDNNNASVPLPVLSVEDTRVSASTDVDRIAPMMTSYDFNATGLPYTAREATTFTTLLTNPTDQTISVPVQWKQYANDQVSEENLRHSQTELVTVEPGAMAGVSYTATNELESQMIVTAEAFYGDYGSMITVGSRRDGLQEEVAIHNPTLSSFPLYAGEEVTMTMCAELVENDQWVERFQIMMVASDETGNEIARFNTNQQLLDGQKKFSATFEPVQDYEFVRLEAVISDPNARVLARVDKVYDCTTGVCERTGQFLSVPWPIILAIAVAGGVALLLISRYVRRSRSEHFTEASEMSELN